MIFRTKLIKLTFLKFIFIKDLLFTNRILVITQLNTSHYIVSLTRNIEF